MNGWRLLGLLLLGFFLIVAQVTWLQSFSWVGLAVNAPLLLVIIAATFVDWPTGLLIAIILGAGYQFFSPLPAWIHPISFILAATTAWVMRRRLVTARTSTSLLLSVFGGTIMYYAIQAGLLLGNRLINDASLLPLWSVWMTAGVWQTVVHPFLAGVWWVLSRQRRTALHVRSW